MPKRREGPVLNRQTRVYYFDQWVGLPPDRARVRMSLHTTDPARARWLWQQEWRRRWSRFYGLEEGAPGPPPTIGELAEEYSLYERDVRRVKEWRTIESRLAWIAGIVGPDRRADALAAADLSRLDAAFRKAGPQGAPLSPASINLYFSTFKGMFAWAIEQGRTKGPNPVRAVRPYTVEIKRRAYGPEEIQAILAAAAKIQAEARPQDGLLRQAGRIVTLLLLTGMRVGEVLNLRWGSVGDDAIRLRRSETKQRREKVVPVTPAMRVIFDEFAALRADDYVLPLRRRGPYMRAGYADNLIRRLREETGIEGFVLHNLRHTAATLMVTEAAGRGVGLADIMAVLGHSTVKTTMAYQHADLGRMRRAVDILGEATGRSGVDSAPAPGYNGDRERNPKDRA
jgi:integrase